MCLAVPAQLIECDETHATADLHGNRVRINILLVPDAKAGDWVLVHSGSAIQIIDEQEAAETWATLEEAQRLVEEAEAAEVRELPQLSRHLLKTERVARPKCRG